MTYEYKSLLRTPPSLSHQPLPRTQSLLSLRMHSSILVATIAASAVAFPHMRDANPDVLQKAAEIAARVPSKLTARQSIPNDPLGFSKAQTNCGPTPCVTFDEADQLVSVTGQNAYASPAPDEIRGPCPGLNAAANHGYLPRSGIVSLEETIAGLGAGKHS